MSDQAQYLRPTPIINSDHPRVTALAREIAGDAATVEQKATRLFEYVRDQIRYDPFSPFFLPEHYMPTFVLDRKAGYCVSKSSLLVGLCRAAQIPARLLLADIKIHRFSGRLSEMMGTNLFTYHGYVDMFVSGRWLKVTPSFERPLSEKLGLKIVPFDGTQDAIFDKYDLDGKLHVEYLVHHGEYADVPLEEIVPAWKRVYGQETVTAWMELWIKAN